MKDSLGRVIRLTAILLTLELLVFGVLWASLPFYEIPTRCVVREAVYR